MNLKSYILLLFFITGVNVLAQDSYTVSGVVKDAQSGEVMPFANVFLAETTYGTSTDDQGKFVMEGIGDGIYDLVVKFVGYKTFISQVQTLDKPEIVVSVLLEPVLKDLGAFVITSKDDRKRSEYLKLFKQEFLGYSKNAVDCKLLNQDDLDITFDPETNMLTVLSEKALVIENKALGFKLNYYLEKFILDYTSSISAHSGYVLFEEIDSPSKRFTRKWQRNREVAYLGSSNHFFTALYQNRLNEEGYSIRFARKEDGVQDLVLDAEDSDLNVYVRHDVETDLAYLNLSDILYITYNNEYESVRYQDFKFRQGDRNISPLINGDWSIPPQKSKLTMLEGYESIVFDENGHIYNPLSFLSEGYWGFEKVAEMLPVNYKPKK